MISGMCLCLQAQRVGLEQRRLAALVFLDHRPAAAGIAAHRGQRHREIDRQDARIDQRTQHGDGAGRVAAGVADAVGLRYRLPVAFDQFGKAEHPAGRHAVRGGGVDDLGFLGRQLVDQRDRFAGRVVVQAQHHEVDAGHEFALGVHVLAQLGRDAHELDLRHRLQPLANLKAGGAGFAVDENLGHIGMCVEGLEESTY
jgi:hypothetical protein